MPSNETQCLFETEQNYFDRFAVEKAKDDELVIELEALRLRLADPNDLPFREDVMGVLNRYHSDERRRDGYMLLFASSDQDRRRNYRSDRYELVTQELVAALASHLLVAKTALGVSTRPLRILELGAGDGKLALHIAAYLDKNAPGQFILSATDDGSWNIPHAANVEIRDITEALETEKPDIVIAAWLPDDWTPLIRQQESVRECILLGDPGCSGAGSRSPWGAYGRSLIYGRELNPEFCKEDAVWPNAGFSCRWLDEITEIQLGYNHSGREGCSKAIAFQR